MKTALHLLLSAVLFVGSTVGAVYVGIAAVDKIDNVLPLQPHVDPAPEPEPTPEPEPKCPHCPRRPWGPRFGSLVSDIGAASSWVNGRSYDGEELTCDFPVSLWMHNIGSKVDGAGMCVSTSIEMCAKYLGLNQMIGFRDYCAKFPGGAYSGKIDKQLQAYCAYRHIKCPRYMHYEGPDPEPILKKLDAARLPYAHTYGYSPRYNGGIAHMVFSVKHNGRYAVVIDNNPVGGVTPTGGKIYEWMSNAEQVKRMCGGPNRGNCWVFAWLEPPPPPCPKTEGK